MNKKDFSKCINEERSINGVQGSVYEGIQKDLSKAYLNNSRVFAIGKVLVKPVDFMLKNKREGSNHQWNLEHHALHFVILHCSQSSLVHIVIHSINWYRESDQAFCMEINTLFK